MSTEIELWAGTHNGQTVVPLCIPLSVTPVLCLVAQLCPTLCDPMHEVPLSMGILQARILERVAISSSRGSSQPRDGTNSRLLRPLHWQAGPLLLEPPEKPALP